MPATRINASIAGASASEAPSRAVAHAVSARVEATTAARATIIRARPAPGQVHSSRAELTRPPHRESTRVRGTGAVVDREAGGSGRPLPPESPLRGRDGHVQRLAVAIDEQHDRLVLGLLVDPNLEVFDG